MQPFQIISKKPDSYFRSTSATLAAHHVAVEKMGSIHGHAL